MKKLTPAKAREILHDKSVHGHPLTDKQRKFFGAISGGAPMKANDGWLDKFDDGGTMQEHQENYNDYTVSAPEGFQGDGYSNVGRNYSPAWGGQFAMGGSLPGSVGFTYARTAGAAPSEGPYAKKTLPSAQNGQEMRYYQEGLDWQPKMISKNGGWLNKFADGGEEKPLPKIGSKEAYELEKAKQNRSESTKVVSKTAPLTEKEKVKNKEINKDVHENSKEYWKKQLEERAAKRKDPGTFSKGNYIIEEPLRLFPNSEGGMGQIADEYLNPAYMIGKMASSLGNAGSKAYYTGDYSDLPGAIAEPLLMGRMMGSGSINPLGKKFWTNSVSDAEFFNTLGMGVPKLLKNLPVNAVNNAGKNLSKFASDISQASNLKEALGRTVGIPIEKTLPRMGADEVKALRQVQEIGRLKSTGSRSADQMKYALENNLPEEHFQKVFGNSREDAQYLLDTGFGQQEAQNSMNLRTRLNERLNRPREAGGSDYELGSYVPDYATNEGVNRSQTVLEMLNEYDANNQLSSPPSEIILPESVTDRPRLQQPTDEQIAAYRAQITNNLNEPRRGRIIIPGQERPRETMFQTLSRDWERYVDRKQPTSKIISNKLENLIQNYPYYSGEVLEKVPSLTLRSEGSLKNVSKKVNFAPEEIQSGDVFTGSTNTSHSSWLPQIKQVFKYTKGDPQFLGYRPMNTLGYLSEYQYKPIEIAKYLNSELDEQIKRGIVPKNISRPYQKGESVMLPHYGIKQHEQGGIVKDDMGYWNPDNHGKIVEISSPDITMEGVDQPLLGISDTGDTKLMQPGENYKFKGKKVTEYPVAKNGVNQQDQKTLEQLDQLTNFTNYNKPQPGGWLNKYN